MPSTGERTVSSSTRCLQVRDDERLAVALQALGAQVERQAVALEPGGIARVLEVQLRGGDVVDGALVVALADGVLVPGPLGAFQFALARP